MPSTDAASIARLEAKIRELASIQIQAFTSAVENAPTLATWPAKEPYWFTGTAGLELTSDEKAALSQLWTRMLVGLAFAISGEDVEVHIARGTLLARLDRVPAPAEPPR